MSFEGLDTKKILKEIVQWQDLLTITNTLMDVTEVRLGGLGYKIHAVFSRIQTVQKMLWQVISLGITDLAKLQGVQPLPQSELDYLTQRIDNLGVGN